jgi:hypothetical protein
MRPLPNINCTIKVFYLPTDAQENCFKRILKFTLKQLLHVSVHSPSPESALFELAKCLMMVIAPKHVAAVLM